MVEVDVGKHREKLPYRHKLIDVNKHRGMDVEFSHHDLVLDDITSEENQLVVAHYRSFVAEKSNSFFER